MVMAQTSGRCDLRVWFVIFNTSGDTPPGKRVCQDFALNLSAKRRLCTTVGGRFIDGTARCCAVVSTARSRAATMTNFARSNQSWVSRTLFGAAKSCAIVNFFMICPPVGSWLADDDQILFLIAAISWLTQGWVQKFSPL
jgi:hypothetical protein